jgi:hypothetical protein
MSKTRRNFLGIASTFLILCSSSFEVRGTTTEPQQVTLGWVASVDPTVVGYYVYYGTTNGVYGNKIDVGSNTTYTVTGLVPDSTNYFTCSSYNAAQVESVHTPQVTYVALGNLTVTAADASRPYGATDPVFTGTIIGLLNGDNITADYSTPATATSPVGAYPITPTLIDPGDVETNYVVTLVNGTLTVTQAAPIVTWTNPTPVIYGTALGPNQLNAMASVPGTFAYFPNNGVTLNTGANALSVIFTPTDAVDYTTLINAAGLIVLPASLTVTAANATRPYGTANPVLTGSVTGLKNGDNITATYSTTATASSSVGTYPVTPALVDPGSRSTNYTVSLANGTLTITQTAPTVTWTSPAPIVYGTALSASQLNATGNVPGSFAYSPANGAVLNAGTNILLVIFTPTDTTDYSNVTNTVSLVVSDATLTITANNRTKTYGQSVTFSGTEFTTSGLVNGDTVSSVTLVSSGTAPTAAVLGSPYTIVPSLAGGTGLTNYSISYSIGNLTISGAPLTVTASSQSKTYGQTVTFASGSTLFASSGLQNGETIGSVTLGVSANGGVATAPVSGSPYMITPSAATGGTFTANNYTISYANGTLAVSSAALTVTAKSRTKTYGQTVTFAGTEFTISGLVNSDGVTSVTLTSSGTAATATVTGSPYSIVPTAASGMGLGNYTISYANGTLAVNPAALTITANNRTKTYGQTATFTGSEFAATGLLNSDTVTTVTLTSSGAIATATMAGSPYSIVPGGAAGIGLPNYTINYINGILTVSGSTPIITWANPVSIVYGAPLAAAQLNATANVPGSFAYTPTNQSVLNAGTNMLSVVFTPTDMADYSTVTDTVSLVVSPAPLTVTASSFNRPFDTANPMFTGTIAGLTNGDQITATYNTTATATSPVGVYPITPSLADPADRQTDYSVSLVNGTLAVGQTAPIVTWSNSAPTVYGVPLSSNELNATANVPGSFAYTPTNQSVLNSGTNTLSVVFTPTDTADYSTMTSTVGLVVAPAPLTVTASGFNRPFDTVNPVFTGTVTGLTNGDNIKATYNCSATISSPVGTYDIAPNLVDPSSRQTNYVVNLIDGILVVGNPTETITWTNPAPVTYGTALTSIQLAATVNVVGSYSYDPTNGAELNAGTNTLSVVFTPADAVDYRSLTDSVTLVVLPAPLTVTAANTNRTYGQANPSFTGTLKGVTKGDSITATYSCGATMASSVGTYAIIPSLADPDNRLTNYSVSSTDGTLTVNPAKPAMTWTNPAPIIYGAALTSNQLNAVATVPGSLTYSLASGAVLDAGTNTLSVIFIPTDTVDYSNATNTVEMIVSPAPLTVTALNTNRLYGAANPVFVGTLTGLTNGDNITAAYTCSATTNSPAGMYEIVPSLVDMNNRLTNYTVSLTDGTLTIDYLLHADSASVGSGGAQMTISAVPGQTYEIQASTNLVNWVNLNAITADPSGILQFFDAAAQNCPQRFYRAVTQ